MSKPFRPTRVLAGEPIWPVIDSLKSHTDRETAIIGVALLDSMLTVVLKSKFSSIDDHDRAFDQGQPLHFFQAKLTVAYLFGIIPKSFKLDLERLNTIRSRFAHDFEAHTFDSLEPAIAQDCVKLTLPYDYDDVAAFVAKTLTDTPTIEPGYERGLFYMDRRRFVWAQAAISDDDLKTNRGLFVTTVRLAWVVLAMTSKLPLLLPEERRQ